METAYGETHQSPRAGNVDDNNDYAEFLDHLQSRDQLGKDVRVADHYQGPEREHRMWGRS